MANKNFRILAITTLALAVAVCGYSQNVERDRSAQDRAALEKTSAGILAGFAKDDVDAVMAYHHPDVVKSLDYKHVLSGRDAVRKDAAAIMQKYRLEWTENHVQSLLIEGDTAVEMTDFTIKGAPKSNGSPFEYHGRSMVVYVRYKESPTGWASIREIIQPAS